jgi:hypothetical protein
VGGGRFSEKYDYHSSMTDDHAIHDNDDNDASSNNNNNNAAANLGRNDWFLPKHLYKDWYKRTTIMIGSYVFIRPFLAIISLCLFFMNASNRALTETIYGIDISVSTLAYFGVENFSSFSPGAKKILESNRVEAKCQCVNFVVNVMFLQQILFAIVNFVLDTYFGVSDIFYFGTSDDTIQNFLICVEACIVCVLNVYFFSVEEWADMEKFKTSRRKIILMDEYLQDKNYYSYSSIFSNNLIPPWDEGTDEYNVMTHTS